MSAVAETPTLGSLHWWRSPDDEMLVLVRDPNQHWRAHHTVWTDDGMRGWTYIGPATPPDEATRTAAVRPDVEKEELEEEIAKIIDPHSFKAWEGMRQHCLRVGDSDYEATRCADATYGPNKTKACAKAGAIIAVLNRRRAPAPASDGDSEKWRMAAWRLHIAVKSLLAEINPGQIGKSPGLVPKAAIGRVKDALAGFEFSRSAPAPSGSQMGDGWQPIKSAPANVDVLLYCPKLAESNPERIELGCASQGWSNDHTSTMSYHSWATHWCHLPPPPTRATDQEG